MIEEFINKLSGSYRYLKDHEKEFRDWYFEGDHDEYPWAFLQK